MAKASPATSNPTPSVDHKALAEQGASLLEALVKKFDDGTVHTTHGSQVMADCRQFIQNARTTWAKPPALQ